MILFGRPVFVLPASSYDAASIVHTKLGYHKGIGMSYFLEDGFCMKKVMPRASGCDACDVRSCAQLNDTQKMDPCVRGPLIVLYY